MPLIAALIGGLAMALGPLIAQILIALGISFVAYSGIDLMMETFKSQAISALGGQGAVFTQFAGVFQLGTAINMICSAITARLVIAGITGGSITKMITKK